MLDKLKDFFRQLPGQNGRNGVDGDDPRVAAAALMYHVIGVDGVHDETEVAKLRQLVSQAYAVHGRELDEILAAGEEAEREAVDFYAFTSLLMRHLDQNARIDFIGLLWEMVYADGEMHEIEDNVVWRVAELLGVSARDRVLMRQKIRDDAGGAED